MMDEETRPDPLEAYLDGRLEGEERRRFEQELAADPALAAEAARLNRLGALLERLPGEREVPAGVTARILEAVEEERAPARRAATARGPEPHLRALFRARRVAWAAAAALLVAALIWYGSRPDPGGSGAPGAAPTARLHIGLRVGAPVPHADYRVYDADLDRVYHAFRIQGRRIAGSYNNLRVPVDLPYRLAKSDARGVIAFGDERPSGMRMVSVELPGSIRQWGLLDWGAPANAAASTSASAAAARLPPSRLFPAEDLVVRGRVVDATSGHPVSGAMVTPPDGSGVLVTNREGRFEGTLSFLPEGDASLLVCARGYAAGTLPVDRKALRNRDPAGPLAGGIEVLLDPALRFDLEFTVEDESGTPLPGAVVLATPHEPHGAASLADRPELAIADGRGTVRLWQLQECAYRLEVHHRNADFAPLTLDVTSPPARITAHPAGGAELAIHLAAADGTRLSGGQVMLARSGDAEGPLLAAALGQESGARFKSLNAGTTRLLLLAGNGVGYELDFEVAPDAELAVPYRLPATPHRVAGRLAPARAREILALRVEADLDPVEFGGRRTSGHRVVAEVAVAPDGTFRFPPLPRCRLVTLEGWSGPFSRTRLMAAPDLAAGLASASAGELTIIVGR